ncbi:MAG: enoyl-CoA hydratase/isomerase family protein [Saprospiraceae bacterium]|nr:enoyl-CoA hydratase/isomerase family protein [Saprospiraceae bacterium]
MQNTYHHWLLDIKEHIAYLTLNRPNKKNRIDTTTLTELGEITEILGSNPSVWVVVVQGAGDCFSAGVDVSLIGNMIGQEEASYRKNLRHAQSFLDAFEALEKPTIAALHGVVIGGGMILALCCDFRIAADNVIFELPEVKRSIGVIMGTQRITRTIGIAHTKEMVMLGAPVRAEQALHMGLVNRVVPVDQLQNQATSFAQQFLELPPLAVGLCKKIIDEGQFLERAGQDLEIEAQLGLLGTQDFKEAIASFFEKRKPIFKGE